MSEQDLLQRSAEMPVHGPKVKKNRDLRVCASAACCIFAPSPRGNGMAETKPMLFVAAAALIDTDGRVLICKRPQGKQLAGLWEFPGGKVEPGESVRAALIRELYEELGITVTACSPWLTREFTYPHA